MRQIIFPSWLIWIDKKFRNLSIPKLPLILTIIQALVLLLGMIKPDIIDSKLVLYPSDVFRGEIWKIFTFIAIPPMNHFMMFFVLWIFYDVMVWLEETWGSMFLTIYFLIAWLSTVFASLLTGIPVYTFTYMECSFLFALATLNPNKELHLFFILPIAFKWIALFLAGILLIVPLFLGFQNQLIYVALSFVNYLLFFGKDYWLRFKKELDKRKKA